MKMTEHLKGFIKNEITEQTQTLQLVSTQICNEINHRLQNADDGITHA